MTALPHVIHSYLGDVVVIQPVGEFDIGTVDMLRAALLEAVTTDHNKVVVDLSATTFVDSMALGVMVGISRHVHERNGWVRLVSPLPNVRKVLDITGLSKVFGVFASVDEASAHVDPDNQGTLEPA